MVSRSGSRSSNGLLPPFHLGHAVSITFFNKKVSHLFSGPFYDPFPFPRTHEYPVSPIDEKPKVAFSRLSASSGPRGLLAIPCSSAARNAAKGRVEVLARSSFDCARIPRECQLTCTPSCGSVLLNGRFLFHGSLDPVHLRDHCNVLLSVG